MILFFVTLKKRENQRFDFAQRLMSSQEKEKECESVRRDSEDNLQCVRKPILGRLSHHIKRARCPKSVTWHCQLKLDMTFRICCDAKLLVPLPTRQMCRSESKQSTLWGWMLNSSRWFQRNKRWKKPSNQCGHTTELSAPLCTSEIVLKIIIMMKMILKKKSICPSSLLQLLNLPDAAHQLVLPVVSHAHP